MNICYNRYEYFHLTEKVLAGQPKKIFKTNHYKTAHTQRRESNKKKHEYILKKNVLLKLYFQNMSRSY